MSAQKLREIEMIKGWNGMPPGTKWTPDMPDVANQLVINGKAKYTDESEEAAPNEGKQKQKGK